MSYISVCIPTYEMHGSGVEFLEHSFGVLAAQTFKDFDVVVSDHSVDEKIRALCEAWKGRLDIKYFKNAEKRGSSSANINNCMRNATGKILKILLQDDFLYDDRALKDIAAAFDPEKDSWLLSASIHSADGTTFYREFHPRYDDATALFKNTVSSPSVLTLRNKDVLFFDEKLLWYTDTDYYKRCFGRFGAPKILDAVSIVNRVGPHQVTNNITENLKEREFRYILEKYQVPEARKRLRAYRFERYERQAKGLIKKMLGPTKKS